MLVSDDLDLVDKARFLATQARDPAPITSTLKLATTIVRNVLAGIGRGQLRVLEQRVDDVTLKFTNKLWETCQE